MSLRIIRASGPVRSALNSGRNDRAERTLGLADDRRRKQRTDFVLLQQLHRFGPQLRRPVDQFVDGDTLVVVCGWLGREGLGGRIPFSGHIALRHRPFLDRPNRLTGHAVEYVEEGLLGGLRDRLDGLSIDSDVDEHRRTRDVHVPDAVVDKLVVPFALTRLQVDGDQGLSKQVGSRAMSAIIVAGAQVDREGGDAEFLIHRNLAPHAGIAGVRPRILLPGLDAELSGPRDSVKDPEAFAGPHVESADVAFNVFSALRRAAGKVRGAYDDDVPGYGWRGVKADFAGDEVDF